MTASPPGTPADPFGRVRAADDEPGFDLVDQALTRAAGAPRVAGNAVRLLRDGPENYPAWLEAIGHAQCYVHFENYILCDDDTGQAFADALAAAARRGVQVRLLYDWMGGLRNTSRGFWRRLRTAGVDVRCFNPPRLSGPVEWLYRDHRKSLAVDGRVGFVSGLCVGRQWAGDAARGIEPWRDTGVEITGPVLGQLAQSFADTWAVAGEPLPDVPGSVSPPAGEAPVRIVANKPGTASVLRLDQLVAAAARDRLWLTDPYFAGIPTYVQALRAAAQDGVDVRLLVPGASDLPVLQPLSQAGFRPLLEAGVRVFEWQGVMLHAKTAVADRAWARVGSSNLNVASWLGNYELDAVVEDESFNGRMAAMFEEDLERSTEIVLFPRRRRAPAEILRELRERRASRRRGNRPPRSSRAGRAAAGALRLGRTVNAAVTRQRILGPAEARVVAIAGLTLTLLALGTLFWPRLIAVPFAVLCLWTAIALFARAHALWQERRNRGLPATRVARKYPETPTDAGQDSAR